MEFIFFSNFKGILNNQLLILNFPFLVGFEEADDKLILPLGADLNIVKQFSEAVRNLDQNK